MYEKYHKSFSMIQLKLAAPLDHGEDHLTHQILVELGYDPLRDTRSAQKLCTHISLFNAIVDDEDLKLKAVSSGVANKLNPTYAPAFVANKYGERKHN